jgi:hypothetical protein
MSELEYRVFASALAEDIRSRSFCHGAAKKWGSLPCWNFIRIRFTFLLMDSSGSTADSLSEPLLRRTPSNHTSSSTSQSGRVVGREMGQSSNQHEASGCCGDNPSKGDYNLIVHEDDVLNDSIMHEENNDNGCNDEEHQGDHEQQVTSTLLPIVRNAVEDDHPEEEDLATIVTPFRCQRFLYKTLLPDHKWTFCGINLVDGAPALKLIKFVLLTAIIMVSMHWLVRRMDWEHNELALQDLYMYESGQIVMDAIVFFAVGRLWKQRGVDHLAWIGWCLLANLYSSYITNFAFLRHSFTLYEIHCKWPWQLWLFIGLVLPVIVVVILLHVHRAVQDQVFCSKVMELILTLVVFLFPLLPSKYFHLHHWFTGWLIGMHCNFDVWWSCAAMAWCWGCYINGIAVYGRDPVLTCGYAYWLSEHMHCPYLECYQWELENATAENDTHPMDPSDWRNCSADGYHP